MEQFFQFIKKSPTAFHAVDNLAKKLEEKGFVRLSEKNPYDLTYGGKYYVIRNDSSLLSFRLPIHSPKGFRVMASHSDSPCFKIKEIAESSVEKAYVKLNVEKYGGMIDSSWLDRPLGIAGRVVADQGEEGLTSYLVELKDSTCIIPNVAIHLNREINQGMSYNAQTDLMPLWAEGESASLLTAVAESLSIDEQDILGKDLFVYNKQQPCYLGINKEFFGSPRIDDLECAFGTMEGFLQAESTDFIQMYCVFDNEEVGSSTRQGADSDFLSANIERICYCLGIRERMQELIANSVLISADNGHALHPNHPEKSDSKNRPLMNKGIVIKFHGSQKYTTDAFTSALVKQICKKENIPYQIYHNRSDIGGGSTLGNISITHSSIPSADIGLAQLSMHSSFETAGSKDLSYLISFSQKFYETI